MDWLLQDLVQLQLPTNHYNLCFLKVLKNRNYEGWLVVEAEQDPAKANPFEYAKIGYNYLSKTAKECGFNIIS